MRFDDKLNLMFDEIDVPEELSPQNIALMLKTKTNQSKMVAEYKNIKSAPSIAVQRRRIIMRTAAATAACAIFAVGMLAYNQTNPDDQVIDPRIDFEAISPESYDTLYDIYTGISLESTAENATTTVTSTDKNTEEQQGAVTTVPNTDTKEPSAVTTVKPIETTTAQTTAVSSELSQDDFSDFEDERVKKADIVKSDGTNLYCLTDGVLYIINMETMEVVSQIEPSLTPPIEFFIEDDMLILISKETEEVQVIDPNESSSDSQNSSLDISVATDDTDTQLWDDESDELFDDNNFLPDNSNDEDIHTPSQRSDVDINTWSDPLFKSGAAYPRTTARTRYNVIADIYNLSDKAFPEHTTTYKQNGSYISSSIINGVLYIITDYSDYRTKPLDNQADLDSFVPGYYLNNEKYYIAANDIIIPSNTNSTDYTVVSAIDCKNPAVSAQNHISVKAVLGSSENVCCSADSIYIVGVGKKDTDYSIITEFSLGKSSDSLTYKACSAIDGIILNQSSLNVHDGMLRIAAKTTDSSGVISTSIYVLDDTLTVIKSAGQLLPNEKAENVRFEGNYASVFLSGKSEPSIVIDLASTPPIQAQSLAAVSSAYLSKFSSDKLLGLSLSDNGLTLSMYNGSNGLLINNITFANNLNDINCPALTSRRALFIDTENSIIGIPVYSHNEFGTINQYYVYSYEDTAGFILKGIIEYNDLDDSHIFIRAVINEDTIYIIGNRRIVSAQKEDLKVINSVVF